MLTEGVDESQPSWTCPFLSSLYDFTPSAPRKESEPEAVPKVEDEMSGSGMRCMQRSSCTAS